MTTTDRITGRPITTDGMLARMTNPATGRPITPPPAPVGDLFAIVHAAHVHDAGYSFDYIENDSVLGIARLTIDQAVLDAPEHVRRHLVCWLACKLDVVATIIPDA